MNKVMIKRLLSIICLFFICITVWSQGFVIHYKNGNIHRIKASQVDSVTTYEYEEPYIPKDTTIFVSEPFSFTMIYVEGGTFLMGGTPEQGDDALAGYDLPVHQVKLNNYYISQTEVTQELWEYVMGVGFNYSWNQESKKLPVENVSWDECMAFVNALNSIMMETGEKFRLPTEAEWEYAARGGQQSGKQSGEQSNPTKYSGSEEIDNVAWYLGNSGNTTHEVMTKDPNELGIYDMSGNVWEWCQDWYDSYADADLSKIYDNPTGPETGERKIFRGGSYSESPLFCRTSNRAYNRPDYRYGDIGFRIVMVKD